MTALREPQDLSSHDAQRQESTDWLDDDAFAFGGLLTACFEPEFRRRGPA